VELARELHDQRCEAQALGLGGVVACARGDLASASERAAESMRLAKRIGDGYLQCWNLHTQGSVLRARNETARAIQHYRRWQEAARRLADRRGTAAASWYLGCLYESAGQHAAARKEMAACVAYEEEMDHPRAAAHRARLESLPKRAGGAHVRGRRSR
jgi:ATP/maltotriose-dependent transcriptional regulator MalT